MASSWLTLSFYSGTVLTSLNPENKTNMSNSKTEPGTVPTNQPARSLPQKIDESLAVLDAAAGQAPLNRPGHVRVQQALQDVVTEVISLTNRISDLEGQCAKYLVELGSRPEAFEVARPAQPALSQKS